MSALTDVAIGVWNVWSFALLAALIGNLYCVLRDSERVELWWRAAARVHQELWILVPPCILLATVHDWHHHPWMVAFDAFALWNWWNVRDWPDENRWKRRGRKAREAIARRGARLVVVPQ